VGRILGSRKFRKKAQVNMSIHQIINRLWTLLKVYVSLALIGAMAVITFAFIEAKPWIAAIIIVALEALILTLFLSNKINLVLEVGSRRLVLGRAHSTAKTASKNLAQS
jgi:hypothetical protein